MPRFLPSWEERTWLLAIRVVPRFLPQMGIAYLAHRFCFAFPVSGACRLGCLRAWVLAGWILLGAQGGSGLGPARLPTGLVACPELK